MTIASRSSVKTDADQQQRIVEETIALIATGGIRGATLRDVAARCGASVASIANLFGNKDGLIAACFAEVVRSDGLRLDALLTECRDMAVPRDLLPAFLWTLCEEAGGARRTEMLVLVELLLSAPASPQFAELCRQWVVARRDGMRALAEAHALDPLAFDIMGLHLISESSFAVSCAASASYALVARAGFIEAAARLAGLDDVAIPAGMTTLAGRFFADPEVGGRGQSVEAKGRGAESRARIVGAAASIIEAEGLSAVTNRAVADRAGVSLALTTYHFKSVTDLSFAGILRVFETVNAGLRTGGGRGDAVDRIRSRSHPSGVERLRSRGMAEISLAAARGLADPSLGLAMRQQRGTITHAGLAPDMRAHVTRTRAASHALWSSGAFLTTTALPDADSLFDFEAQARFAADRLLRQS